MTHFAIAAFRRAASGSNQRSRVESSVRDRHRLDFRDRRGRVGVAQAQRYAIKRARIDSGAGFEFFYFRIGLSKLGRVARKYEWQILVDTGLQLDYLDRDRYG